MDARLHTVCGRPRATKPRPLLNLDVCARPSEVGLVSVPGDPTAGGLSPLARRPRRPTAPAAGFQFVR